MVFYEDEVIKALKKGFIPKEVFKNFHETFMKIDSTKKILEFDIKQLKTSGERVYYRLRKGKFRAIFYIENQNYYAKREEVYKKWKN